MASPGGGGQVSRANVGSRRRPVRVAVVGLGYWGPNLVRNFHELDGGGQSRESATCGASVSMRSRSATRPCAGRRGLGDVLNDPTVEAVAIATPVSTHHEIASAALRAGKHVFIEKPFAASSAEALDLIALAEDRGLVRDARATPSSTARP